MAKARPRTPNFVRFILTGAVLGFAIGGLLAVLTDPAPSYSASSGVGYFGLMFGGLGALLAAIVAIALERRS